MKSCFLFWKFAWPEAETEISSHDPRTECNFGLFSIIVSSLRGHVSLTQIVMVKALRIKDVTPDNQIYLARF